MHRAFLQTFVYFFSLTTLLYATGPDITNLNKCIFEVRNAALNPPIVLTFDRYKENYTKLLIELEEATSHLPYVYQEAASKPFMSFLIQLGEEEYLRIFNEELLDAHEVVLQHIIPDAALAILEHTQNFSHEINAFQEIVSDLYEGFLNSEKQAGVESSFPIEPPTYGIIPPLVKFGEQNLGPYTWPADATSAILGMECGIVSLPPSQIKGGLVAWSSLAHETGGHDVTHADADLLEELAKKVFETVYQTFGSQKLAEYWAQCIDETVADVCGYLNMGPSFGIALIGYFRALGDGKLRTLATMNDPHPIDLLRGYLGSAVVKNLHFNDALLWSQTIADEASKDNDSLYLVDSEGNFSHFPVSLNIAIASTHVVANVIMTSTLDALQGHSLQGIENWVDTDQTIVDQLVSILKSGEDLPTAIQGPGFYASYVVAAATQAGLQKGTNIRKIFETMQNFLSIMHTQNPTWSKHPTEESVALLENQRQNKGTHNGKQLARHEIPSAEVLAIQ